MKTITPDLNILLDCGHPASEHSECTTGYARDNQGRKHCYACCARQDREWMQAHGRITLYLTTLTPTVHKGPHGNNVRSFGMYGDCKITNWPGSLTFKGRFHLGRHNIAGTRYDVWFNDEQGNPWHGIQYGEHAQIIRCRKLKR